LDKSRPSLKNQFHKVYITLFFLILIFTIFILLFNKVEISRFVKNKITDLEYKKYKNIIATQSLSIKNYIDDKRKNLNNEIIDNLRSNVYRAYDTAYLIFNRKKNKISFDEIKKLIKIALKYQRFNNSRGYYFIFSDSGKKILSPFKMEKTQNQEKSFNIRKIIKSVIAEKEYVYSAFEPHPIYKDRLYKKISFVKLFEPFNWIIGTGDYYEHFEKKLKEEILLRLKKISMPANTGFLLISSDYVIMNRGNIDISISDVDNLNSYSYKNIGHYCVKLAYKIPDWNWKIVIYFDKNAVKKDINQAIKEFQKKLWFVFLFILFTILTGLIILTSSYKKISKRIVDEFEIFKRFFSELPEKFSKINTKSFYYREFFELSSDANKMSSMLENLYKDRSNLIKKITAERDYHKFIIENIGIAVIITDKENNIEFINSEAKKLLKYSDGAFKNDKFHDLFKLTDKYGNRINRERCPICNMKKTKEKIFSEEFVIYDKDNNKIHISLQSVPVLKNNKLNKNILSFRNINKRIERMREIEKLKRAIEQVPVSIVITDTSGTIEYVNPFFSEVTGYSTEEAIGNNPRVLKTKYNDKLYNDLWSSIKAGKTWEGEFLNKKKNGELYWEKAIISPVINSIGEIVNFVAVKQDITELKKIHKELVEAKEKAEAANREKSQFLANMSHEIRTPMNAIIGFSELLLDTEINEIQKKYIELVKSSSENLLRILNDILDISKLESGKMDYNDAPFNLYSLIEHQISIFSQKASEKGLKIKYKIDKSIPETFKGDEIRIAQIISNLLNNAIKFTLKGEIGLEVELNSKKDTSYTLLFKIYDTGIGIPKSKLKSIFSPFIQADASVTKRFGGTGLGLSISQKIIKHYNGKIWVESKEGLGSVFYFTLNLEVGQTNVKKRKKETTDKIYFKDARVLIAEDNITNQILIQEFLKKINIKPVVVNNGIEALEKLSEENFDIILMDWHMPEMDGLEALKILRAAEKGETIEDNIVPFKIYSKLLNRKYIIVALTAAAMVHERKKLLEMGFDEYLSKPIRPSIMIKVLKKFLKNYEKVDENKQFSVDNDNKVTHLSIDRNNLIELVGDNKEVLEQLVESFKETFSESLENIKEGIEQNNFKKISFAAHTLKGAAGSMGITKIETIAESIEFAAKDENLAQVKLEADYLSNIKIELD